MAGSGKKWLIGCGIAFVIGILLVVAMIYGGIQLGKKAVEKFEEVGAVTGALEDRFGGAETYIPDADGRIRPERMEAFLNARAAMAPFRQEFESTLALLDGDESSDDASGSFLSKGRAGLKLIPGIIGFFGERAEACLEAEIGLGEYAYIYVVSYYGLLQKQVAAGPGFVLTSADGDRNNQGRGDDEFAVREARREMILSTSRELFLDLLQNQLDASRLLPRPGPEPWEAELQIEIEKLQNDPYRLPWNDGLPEQLATSIEPYRERLESSWSEMCNALEIGPQLD